MNASGSRGFGKSAATGDTAPSLAGWTHVYSGKVREIYASESDPDALLLVASDRVSAFDHLLEPRIPGKGELLTRLTRFWLGMLDAPNHLRESDGWDDELPDDIAARSMRTARLDMFPIECVVRGHITGSALTEYRETGSVCGVTLPPGLEDGDELPEPIYTPAFKAEQGEHDENITFARSAELVGPEAATALRELSLSIFQTARDYARERGLILADTKFEFGRDPASGQITLADEVLTSDSSRYWDETAHADASLDRSARLASFDKQVVRDWLRENWDGEGEPPVLPDEVVRRTRDRYAELAGRLGVPGA